MGLNMHISIENDLVFSHKDIYLVYRVSYAGRELIGICQAYSMYDIASRFSKEDCLLLVPVRIERIAREYQKKKEALQKKFKTINNKLDLLEYQRREVSKMLDSFNQ